MLTWCTLGSRLGSRSANREYPLDMQNSPYEYRDMRRHRFAKERTNVSKSYRDSGARLVVSSQQPGNARQGARVGGVSSG